MLTLNYFGPVGFDLTQERRIAFNEHHTGAGAIIFKHARRNRRSRARPRKSGAGAAEPDGRLAVAARALRAVLGIGQKRKREIVCAFGRLRDPRRRRDGRARQDSGDFVRGHVLAKLQRGGDARDGRAMQPYFLAGALAECVEIKIFHAHPLRHRGECDTADVRSRTEGGSSRSFCRSLDPAS